MDNKAIKNIILILVIVIFTFCGFFLGNKYAESKTTSEPLEKPETEKVTELKSAYSIKIDPATSAYSETANYIFFRKDGSFRYNKDGINYVGNYEVKDNTVTLKPTVSFETNGCYLKEVKPDVTAVIEEDKLLVTFPGEQTSKEYVVETTITEDENQLKTYSINPVDGDYKDCTNQDKV